MSPSLRVFPLAAKLPRVACACQERGVHDVTLPLVYAGSRDGPGRNRTSALRIMSPLLYQLSYRP